MYPSIWLKKINFSDYDIVNLHWTGKEILSIHQYNKINKPWVLTLHDLWMINGSEHINQSHFDLNEKLLENFFFEDLINKLILNFKKKVWKKEFYLIAPSYWVKDKIEKSEFSSLFYVRVIHHPIDHHFWKPMNKSLSKKKLNLNIYNKTILLNAVGGKKNIAKGINEIDKYLFKLNNILNHKKLNILIIGKKIYNNHNYPNLCIINFDFIKDDVIKRNIYSASDVFVSMSLCESFGLMVQEVNACGIPAVIYKNTGSSDIIKNYQNGILVEKNNLEALVDNTIICIKKFKNLDCNENNSIHKLSKKIFNSSIICKQYIDFYNFIINKYSDLSVKK